MGRQRERLATEKEIERIRNSLQAVTGAVHPLGKLVDFIQEDLETMHREWDRWRTMNQELEKRLKERERCATFIAAFVSQIHKIHEKQRFIKINIYL